MYSQVSITGHVGNALRRNIWLNHLVVVERIKVCVGTVFLCRELDVAIRRDSEGISDDSPGRDRERQIDGSVCESVALDTAIKDRRGVCEYLGSRRSRNILRWWWNGTDGLSRYCGRRGLTSSQCSRCVWVISPVQPPLRVA
jgi:hypothetical protein